MPNIELTHCGLVTPYSDIDLGHNWLRQWLAAWQHQAITWTNVDSLLVRMFSFHLKAITQQVHNLLYNAMNFKNYTFKIMATSPKGQ